MNKKYLELAAKFLEDFSIKLGDSGCNDYDFSLDWTAKDKQEFCKYAHKLNGDPENYDENQLELQDFFIAWVLAQYLYSLTESENEVSTQ